MITKYMPNTFSIGGVEYVVSEVDYLHSNYVGLHRGALGKIDILRCTVTKDNSVLEDIPPTSKENTFYHELVHAMFNIVGRHDLQDDETLTQNMGNVLYEFIRTNK